MFDAKTRILVVDDMLIMRKQIVRLCNEIGFMDVLEAKDGAQALQVLQNEKPLINLVISDYDMPNANGLDLFKRIHGDSRFGKIPFLLVALEAERDAVATAVKAGVNGYILKPFSAEDLKTRLEGIFEKIGI